MNRTKKGFSLVEILIVIAIMGISTGVVLKVADNPQKTKSRLETEGGKLSAIINSQKNDALIGKKDSTVASGCKYQIQVDADRLGYKTLGCNQAIQKLPSGIIFRDVQDVSFAPPMATVQKNNGTIDLNSDEKVDFVLEDSSSGYAYTVSVFGVGNLAGMDGVPVPLNCTSPWSETVLDGASTTAYSASSVACGSLCSGISQVRTCNNGVLSGSFANKNCSVAVCPPICANGVYNAGTGKCQWAATSSTDNSLAAASCNPDAYSYVSASAKVSGGVYIVLSASADGEVDWPGSGCSVNQITGNSLTCTSSGGVVITANADATGLHINGKINPDGYNCNKVVPFTGGVTTYSCPGYPSATLVGATCSINPG